MRPFVTPILWGIGEQLYASWSLVATNLEEAARRFAPQLRDVGRWLLSVAANVGFAILEFIFAMIIAGVVLARGAESQAGFERLMRRLAGASGTRLAELSLRASWHSWRCFSASSSSGRPWSSCPP